VASELASVTSETFVAKTRHELLAMSAEGGFLEMPDLKLVTADLLDLHCFQTTTSPFLLFFFELATFTFLLDFTVTITCTISSTYVQGKRKKERLRFTRGSKGRK
jgi:hypothetical protein